MLKNILEIQTSLNKNVYGNKYLLFAPKSFIYLLNDTTDRADRCYRDRETKQGVISRGRQQVAKLCILGHPPLVPLHLPFSSCPFSLKHSDCHLTPPRVIFLERRKPPFSLFLIWPQPKPTVAFPMWAHCTTQGYSQPVHGVYRECLHRMLSGWASMQSSSKGKCVILRENILPATKSV